MPAFARLISVSVAWATAVGVVVPVIAAAPGAAAPCSQTISGAPLNTPRATIPLPVQHEPTGRKPAGAPDSAPLPPLGPLPPAAVVDSPVTDTPDSAPVDDQAALLPLPPPGVPNLTPGPNAAAPQTPVAPGRAAAATPPTAIVGWLDGPNSPNNTYARFDISGADLGVVWDNGQAGADDEVLIAFGDTYGNCSVPGQEWRRNTLFRSGDHTLSDGVTVPDPVYGNIYAGSPVNADRPNFSKEIIDSLNLVPTEASIIPTAGIAVGTTQYVNFMSVKQWGSPGHWTTNFAAIAVSVDNGENWAVASSTIRPRAWNSVPGVRFVSGNDKFQQGAFMRPGDGYVYSFGTPNGRGGAAYLSRVPENAVLDLTQYEYWSHSWLNQQAGSWVRNKPSAATPVISAPVSEMSAQYNAYLNKYIVLYCNHLNNVVMRTADNPQGPWSRESTLVTSAQIPGGIYAPFIHPWSSGSDLYFNLSLWSAYSVMLMHTTLP